MLTDKRGDTAARQATEGPISLFHRPTWLYSEEKRRFYGIRLKWIFIASTAVATIAVVLCVVLSIILRRKRPDDIPATGTYPQDAPFREVLRTNFPDPALFRLNGTWYAFGTNNAAGILHSNLHGEHKDLGAANIQVVTSTNFMNWTLHDHSEDPLPRLGDWVSKEMMRAEADRSVSVRRANVWAPEVLRRPDGKFVLYYSATAANSTAHCIGASLSDNIEGPYEPLTTPLACPAELGGAIDPASFIDTNGTSYIAFKLDGNARGNGGECGNTVPPLRNTPIFLQKIEEDGLTTSGSPITILDRTDEDGPLVEAPAFVKSNEGVYFLFFSSGCTRSPSYDLKYATSKNITGPYTRASEPLLKTAYMGLLAPGSVSFLQDGERLQMAFHARVYTEIGGVRAMYVADLLLNDTSASLRAPF